MKKIIAFNIENYNRKVEYPIILKVRIDEEILKTFPSKIVIENQEYLIDYNKMQIVIYSH